MKQEGERIRLLCSHDNLKPFQAGERVLTKRLLFIFVASLVYLSLVPQPVRAQESQQSARPPQAKSQQEHDDFMAAYAVKGAAASEKAAEDFASRYPASELRRNLYSNAMQAYQNEDNPAKMLALGERVLALDPDDVLVLVRLHGVGI